MIQYDRAATSTILTDHTLSTYCRELTTNCNLEDVMVCLADYTGHDVLETSLELACDSEPYCRKFLYANHQPKQMLMTPLPEHS